MYVTTQTSQEAAPLHRPQSCVAPQLGLACRQLGHGHLSSLITYIKSINSAPPPAPTVCSKRIAFDMICVNFAAPGGWVHNVCILHSGSSCLRLPRLQCHAGPPQRSRRSSPCDPCHQPPHAIYVIKLPSLPFILLSFCSETKLVAAGHNSQPMLFQGNLEASWQLVKTLDERTSASASAQDKSMAAAGIGRLNNEAFNLFCFANSRGLTCSIKGAATSANRTGVDTVHSNTTTSIC
ncbi:hypothetical protein PTTG_09701, partial [Puccinia triticina 1-1 BBBD Race 1]